MRMSARGALIARSGNARRHHGKSCRRRGLNGTKPVTMLQEKASIESTHHRIDEAQIAIVDAKLGDHGVFVYLCA